VRLGVSLYRGYEEQHREYRQCFQHDSKIVRQIRTLPGIRDQGSGIRDQEPAERPVAKAIPICGLLLSGA
jgi:hypothetical protein